MKHYLAIGEAARQLGVCRKTIRRWEKAGHIQCYRTPGGHRRIAREEIDRLITGRKRGERAEKRQEGQKTCGTTAIYARVSSHDQKKKGDLGRQVKAAQQYCRTNKWGEPQVFQDVSSGLNTNRPGLLRLCRAIEQQTINRVIVTYPDRLTRFGLSYLANYWQSHGATIEIMKQPSGRSMEDELVQDMIAIITSFSGRVHGLRSAQTRRQKKSKINAAHKKSAPNKGHKRRKDSKNGEKTHRLKN